DFFADKDVCSIALEVPNAALGPQLLGLWARILSWVDGSWVQVERGARASQTPFLTGESNAAYRAAEPADDARFVGAFAHSLEHWGGYAYTTLLANVSNTGMVQEQKKSPHQEQR